MTRIQLMKSMIVLNEKLNGRKLSPFEKLQGIVLMTLQSKAKLTKAEFSLRAYVNNMDNA